LSPFANSNEHPIHKVEAQYLSIGVHVMQQLTAIQPLCTAIWHWNSFHTSACLYPCRYSNKPAIIIHLYFCIHIIEITVDLPNRYDYWKKSPNQFKY